MPKGVYIRKIGLKRKPHTEEAKDKMRGIRPHTSGVNNHFYGKKHTKETKRKMGLSQKGNTNRRGVKLSDETKRKMSLAHLGKKHTQEHIDKIRESSAKGKDSVHYIQDRTKLKISDKKHLDQQYRDWMFAVKTRDNWTCMIGDENCNGRIEAHHILRWSEYPELRYKINNGITLCHAHHPLKKSEEKRLATYFTELVSVSKV